jgi:hypothetical protein
MGGCRQCMGIAESMHVALWYQGRHEKRRRKGTQQLSTTYFRLIRQCGCSTAQCTCAAGAAGFSTYSSMLLLSKQGGLEPCAGWGPHLGVQQHAGAVQHVQHPPQGQALDASAREVSVPHARWQEGCICPMQMIHGSCCCLQPGPWVICMRSPWA